MAEAFTNGGFKARAAADATIEFTIPRADIGNPSAVDVAAAVTSVGTYYTPTVDTDRAPDAGTFHYSLAALTLGRSRVAPTRPRAGTTAVVTMPLAGAEEDAIARCTARIVGGKALTTRPSVKVGAVVCSFKLPATAKKKKVSGRVTVTSTDRTASAPFAFATRP